MGKAREFGKKTEERVWENQIFSLILELFEVQTISKNIFVCFFLHKDLFDSRHRFFTSFLNDTVSLTKNVKS